MTEIETMSIYVGIVALFIGLIIMCIFYMYYKMQGKDTEKALKEGLSRVIEHKKDIDKIAKDIVKGDKKALKRDLIHALEEVVDEFDEDEGGE